MSDEFDSNVMIASAWAVDGTSGPVSTLFALRLVPCLVRSSICGATSTTS